MPKEIQVPIGSEHISHENATMFWDNEKQDFWWRKRD
jgi:hypothetical protein